LVGDGKERTNLERQAKELQLTNVTFAGARPKQEMKDFLAASDVGLATLQNIPMFSMTYPNKVFDYMAAARPTVLGIDGVIRKVVEAADGGQFVQPENDKELADTLQQLSQQPDRVKKMGATAREYVDLHFNRADQAQQFVELIEKVASNRE